MKHFSSECQLIYSGGKEDGDAQGFFQICEAKPIRQVCNLESEGVWEVHGVVRLELVLPILAVQQPLVPVRVVVQTCR